MNKIISLIVILLVVFGIFRLLSKNPQLKGVSMENADLVMFWGDGCPHCEKVKSYISDNKLEAQVKISYKEVYYDKTNQKILTDTVKKCPEIDTSQGIGVPLAYIPASNKCLLGDQPIIDWLKTRMVK